LAILKGRVDGLEARVGELEATQFSTTTKLVGQTTFVIGANSFAGDAKDIFGDERDEEAAAASGATVFNYDMRLELNTSFTGKDLLKTRLRAGNFGDSPYGGGGYVGLDAMEVAYGESGKADQVKVDRLWYQFPVGEEFTVTAGAMVRQDNMLAVWPSNYPAETILDVFTYAGAPGAYSLTKGGGAGIWWDDNDSGWSISASYVSGNADDGNPNTGGIATDGAASNATAQIAYADEQWGIAAVYSYTSGDNGAGIYAGNATPLAVALAGDGTTNSYAVSAWWAPEDTGWFPSISAGWGLNSVNNNDDDANLIDNATSQSWYVGLQWEDAFIEGNVLGAAVGQPTFVTAVDYDDDVDASDFVADGNYAFELWYKFQVTDNISVTPAVYYLSRPLGDLTAGGGPVFGGGRDDDTFSNFGGLVRTTFKF
ncbi:MULTISPECIES: iron uptake porin, partial [Prochlorococcus]